MIQGEPCVYNRDYEVLDLMGTFTERMAPGVATAALARGVNCKFQFDHGGLPMASTASGTMTLTDTSRALTFEARLDARQQVANDLAIAVSRQDVSAMSIGFRVAKDSWTDDMTRRTVLSFEDILDVSAVTWPCSPTTSIEVAQRMALDVPVESRARLRQLYVDMRSGKVLSKANAEHVEAAVGRLHSVLNSAGIDPRQIGADGFSGPRSSDGARSRTGSAEALKREAAKRGVRPRMTTAEIRAQLDAANRRRVS